MKKLCNILLLPIIIALAIGGFVEQAHAQVSATVAFEQTPLFSNVNFVPGDSVSKWIKVNNTTADSHRVILRAINVTNTGNLKDVIGLVIKQGDTVLYDATFADLFSRSEIVLPRVPAGSSTQFDLIATFKTTAGNDYQHSTMGFNLQIGFEDTGEMTNDTVAVGGQQGGSGGGSGGGSNGPIVVGQKNLIISSELANSSPEPQPGVLFITWTTNIPSTSQVVYGLASDGPYTLNLTLANFGYPSGTIEDTTKVTAHSVQLTGLVSNQLYSYRVVSRASPPTISTEYSFILNEDGTMNTHSRLAIASQRNEQNNTSQSQQGAEDIAGASTFSVGEADATTNTSAEDSVGGKHKNLTAAALLTGFSLNSIQSIILSILALIGIVAGLWFWRRS